ncbi:MAG TPA: hypothetical protein DHV55_18530 [Clostridiaceae bacterium]|nr:hypothetical protein [Clostridiaceae bacterium]
MGHISEYDKLVKEYNNAYKEIVDQIDPEKVSESIHDNDLPSKFEQLGGLLDEIEENVPKGKLSDIMLLKQRHKILDEVIEKGLKWDTLKGLERLAAENSLELLKSDK